MVHGPLLKALKTKVFVIFRHNLTCEVVNSVCIFTLV